MQAQPRDWDKGTINEEENDPKEEHSPAGVTKLINLLTVHTETGN